MVVTDQQGGVQGFKMLVKSRTKTILLSGASLGTCVGVANGTSKNVGLGKFFQDLEISEAFMISLEVSFFHGLFLLF